MIESFGLISTMRTSSFESMTVYFYIFSFQSCEHFGTGKCFMFFGKLKHQFHGESNNPNALNTVLANKIMGRMDDENISEIKFII